MGRKDRCCMRDKNLALIKKDIDENELPRVHVRVKHKLDPERKADWLIRGKDDWGQTKWFVRFAVTGLHPRHFGEFETKDEATTFYQCALYLFEFIMYETLQLWCRDGMLIEREVIKVARTAMSGRRPVSRSYQSKNSSSTRITKDRKPKRVSNSQR